MARSALSLDDSRTLTGVVTGWPEMMYDDANANQLFRFLPDAVGLLVGSAGKL